MRLLTLFAVFTVSLAVDLTAVDEARDKFYSTEETLWKNVIDPTWQGRTALGGDIELTKAFVAFNDVIESIPRPPQPPLPSWLWKQTSEKLNIIDGFYKHFVEFVKRQTVAGAVPAPVKEWLDVAEQVLLDTTPSSVAQAVRKLDDLLSHGDMFRTALQDHQDLCEFQLSQHQLIYDMYNTISLTEIKGYAMMQFSWMLLRIYGKGNFTQEASLTRQRYTERTAQTATAARSALFMAKRDLYRCDPAIHQEGETYAQITRLLQGYIENEVDMNTEATCRDNCAYYTLAESHDCFKDQYCSKQKRCMGRIIDCNYIDSDMWVCPASMSSHRRYEWIEYENGRTLGQVGHCRRGTTKVDSWWRWLFWHCSYCMCLCDDASFDSDRYFSLWDSTSDVRNNKVVTGIRLVKMGRVFHLQISEGTLKERGHVTPGRWVPVQKFDPNDKDIKQDVDYHTLTYEKRAIDLDELDSPTGSIMTGVRLRMLGPHLHFEIRSTPFNYTTGRLAADRSVWISNDNTDGAPEKPRKKLELYKPDIPTRYRSVSLPVDSNHDQYLEFTHSDFEADAAQSTVPFIDIQPVQPMKGASLLSGAGIIHRGVTGSGGFVAVKVLTYDYSRHVRADPPPTTFDEDGETTEFVPVVN
ncbi:uncharacterized protein LOC113236030 isoform X3 [Hyposmocoma kahamanoa]|uniref:uncharacterized protein LOC113236030 isoform X3 n=1 Tax=Hyposmocoma kahamanoa TaxID=1477025 RepID=UPI000E6D71EF|nr:uncharacterized protein LOC113236030 isoform X3 [Hyposmocoma kahamanoa]